MQLKAVTTFIYTFPYRCYEVQTDCGPRYLHSSISNFHAVMDDFDVTIASLVDHGFIGYVQDDHFVFTLPALNRKFYRIAESHCCAKYDEQPITDDLIYQAMDELFTFHSLDEFLTCYNDFIKSL